jgi:hypothetical protein
MWHEMMVTSLLAAILITERTVYCIRINAFSTPRTSDNALCYRNENDFGVRLVAVKRGELPYAVELSL